MTDRYSALIVTLDENIRDDAAEPLIAAIRMLRGVASVEPRVANIDQHIATARARIEMRNCMWDAIEGKR